MLLLPDEDGVDLASCRGRRVEWLRVTVGPASVDVGESEGGVRNETMDRREYCDDGRRRVAARRGCVLEGVGLFEEDDAEGGDGVDMPRWR